MQYAQQKDELTPILGELESLLQSEALVLRHLDRQSIDDFATQKLEIYARLDKLLNGIRPERHHRAQLERIHRAAIHNQLLLVHARDTVRGTLALLTGEAPARSPSAHPASSGGMRVNLRG
jgi:hypothetical protein